MARTIRINGGSVVISRLFNCWQAEFHWRQACDTDPTTTWTQRADVTDGPFKVYSNLSDRSFWGIGDFGRLADIRSFAHRMFR